MVFTRWSSVDPSSLTYLKPDLGIRDWNQLDAKSKSIILQNFLNKGWFVDDLSTYKAISAFAEAHKLQAFCKQFLEHGGPHYSYGEIGKCCLTRMKADCLVIIKEQVQHVVYEFFSYYANFLSTEKLVRFKNCFNDIFEQFGLNVIMTDDALIPRQDQYITEEIYKPTLLLLADEKWKSVNRDLNDAFKDYLIGTPEAYSSSITHAISAFQAFLQILVRGTVGTGDINTLLAEAMGKNLIPSDSFSRKIFKDIESALMTERQLKGDPHPKSEYANQKSARLVLNLVMISFQHFLQP